MAGKRFYMTASTAREHTSKLWQNEGGLPQDAHIPTILIAAINHFSINLPPRVLFEVALLWRGGSGITAGRQTLLLRPVLPGNAGGSTMQVVASAMRESLPVRRRGVHICEDELYAVLLLVLCIALWHRGHMRQLSPRPSVTPNWGGATDGVKAPEHLQSELEELERPHVSVTAVLL